MRDHDRAQAQSSIWRFITDLALGRLSRRIATLKAENDALADKIAKLDKMVARQGGQLRFWRISCRP